MSACLAPASTRPAFSACRAVPERPVGRGFPAWATIPSGQDLATGRVVHFFFAWILSGTLLVWLAASLINGHLRRDLAPRIDDLRRLPRDIADHAKLKFHHTRDYNTLQKLAYGGVLFILLPLMILTGLAMSPIDERGDPVPRRHAGRPPDRPHHPFRRDAASGRLLHHTYSDDPRGRPDQRAPVDHHRLVSHRRRARATRPEGAPDHAEIPDQPPQIPDRRVARRDRPDHLRLRRLRFPRRPRRYACATSWRAPTT